MNQLAQYSSDDDDEDEDVEVNVVSQKANPVVPRLFNAVTRGTGSNAEEKLNDVGRKKSLEQLLSSLPNPKRIRNDTIDMSIQLNPIVAEKKISPVTVSNPASLLFMLPPPKHSAVVQLPIRNQTAETLNKEENYSANSQISVKFPLENALPPGIRLKNPSINEPKPLTSLNPHFESADINASKHVRAAFKVDESQLIDISAASLLQSKPLSINPDVNGPTGPVGLSTKFWNASTGRSEFITGEGGKQRRSHQINSLAINAARMQSSIRAAKAISASHKQQARAKYGW